MREVDFDDLDSVSGGLALGAVSLVGTTQTQPGTFPFADPQQGFFQGGFTGYPQFGGPFQGGGHGAMSAFLHDPTFQTALDQFQAQRPDLAQALAPLDQAALGQNGNFGFRGLMHDPAGRAALDQFLDDPTFQGALQQFSAAHPDIADRLQRRIERLDDRLENGGFHGGPFEGQFEGQGFGPPGYGPQFFGPPGPQGFGPPFASPFTSPFGTPPIGNLQVTPNGYSYSYSSTTPVTTSPLGTPGAITTAGSTPI